MARDRVCARAIGAPQSNLCAPHGFMCTTLVFNYNQNEATIGGRNIV